jgi:hypothetical protein
MPWKSDGAGGVPLGAGVFLIGREGPRLKPLLVWWLFRGMNAPAPSGFALCANYILVDWDSGICGWARGDEAGWALGDSRFPSGMTTRKARDILLGFVQSHPIQKTERMGHPIWGLGWKVPRLGGSTAPELCSLLLVSRDEALHFPSYCASIHKKLNDQIDDIARCPIKGQT